MFPPESDDPAPAPADSPAEPAHGPLWTRLWDGSVPLSTFIAATLALDSAALDDVPRGNQVILWEIFRTLAWAYSVALAQIYL